MIWGEGGGCLFCLHMQNTLWVLTQRLAKATSMLMQIQLKPHPFLYVEMAFLSKTEMYIFFYYVFFLITWPIRLKTWFSYCSRRSACYPGRVFKHAPDGNVAGRSINASCVTTPAGLSRYPVVARDHAASCPSIIQIYKMNQTYRNARTETKTDEPDFPRSTLSTGTLFTVPFNQHSGVGAMFTL